MDNQNEKNNQPPPQKSVNSEIIFVLLLGIFVIYAFVQALGYDFVSARAPLVIMVPLIILLFIHFIRLLRSTEMSKLVQLFTSENEKYKKVLSFVFWLIVLAVLIFITGHYVGIALFMLVLLRLSKEKWLTTILLVTIITALIFIFFENVFGIELYRGMIYRMWRGYDVF